MPTGKSVSENRLFEMLADGTAGEPVSVPLEQPFTSFFTATVRGGSPPSDTLDLLGVRAGGGNAISYARIRWGRHGPRPERRSNAGGSQAHLLWGRWQR